MTAGLYTLEFESPHGPVPVLLFYPTSAPEATVRLGNLPVEAAQNAPPAPGPYPLVVISHGSGSQPALWRGLARTLAHNGFIVALPRHPGNNRQDNSLADTETNLRLRPAVISATITAVLDDPKLAPVIDPRQVFAVGHSMGAYAILAAAGGVARSTIRESGGEPGLLVFKHDPRLTGLVLLNPAAGWFDYEGTLGGIDRPILMVSGDADTVTGQWHGDVIRRRLGPGAKLTDRLVKNAGHFSFMTPFPADMKSPDLAPSQDPEGFDREAFQPQLADEVIGFFRRHGA